jgi:pseudaminic acid biosynthesis-associated methylase
MGFNKMKYKTEQENFWAGKFGDEYIERNRGPALLAANLNFFNKALSATKDLRSCIEFGANIGMNLKALGLLYPNLRQYAIEINSEATTQLASIIPRDNIYEESILNFVAKKKYDLVLIKGVLIHINPDHLKNVYQSLVNAMGKYLLIAEYYNPSPVSLPYRGHTDKLFKRDFAGEILDNYQDLELVDYGFSYHRDPSFPQDDINWFLIKKKA